jgi:cysteine desulfurase family protein
MKKEVYLDWAATSYKKPKKVVDSIKSFLENIGVSSGRGAYKRAFAADSIVHECRKEAAKLFGVPDPARIILTSGATESINLVLKGFLQREDLHEGDHVVTTSLEHNAVIRTLHRLKKEKNISYTIVKSDEKGYFELSDFKKSITKKTRLFAINHASNVIGTILPVDEITKIAQGHGIKVLLDAAQTAGAINVNADMLGVDFIAFTGHKSLLGPAGTGGLYIKEGTFLEPLKEGGTGSDSASCEMPENLPERFEAGTLNYPGICGLKEGIKYVNDTRVETIRKNGLEIIKYMLEGLSSIKHVKLYGCGCADDMTGVFAFNAADLDPGRVAHILDTEHDIMVRAGLHCAPLAHETIGTVKTGTVRASIGHITTKDEIDYFIGALEKIIK